MLAHGARPACDTHAAAAGKAPAHRGLKRAVGGAAIARFLFVALLSFQSSPGPDAPHLNISSHCDVHAHLQLASKQLRARIECWRRPPAYAVVAASSSAHHRLVAAPALPAPSLPIVVCAGGCSGGRTTAPALPKAPPTRCHAPNCAFKTRKGRRGLEAHWRVVHGGYPSEVVEPTSQVLLCFHAVLLSTVAAVFVIVVVFVVAVVVDVVVVHCPTHERTPSRAPSLIPTHIVHPSPFPTHTLAQVLLCFHAVLLSTVAAVFVIVVVFVVAVVVDVVVVHCPTHERTPSRRAPSLIPTHIVHPSPFPTHTLAQRACFMHVT